MRLIANRQLHGEYGTVAPGQEFEVRDEIAKQLIANGVVEPATAPTVTYGIKATGEAARPGFCDLSLSDAESAGVATEGDSVLPGADVSEVGATRRRRRRTSKGSSPAQP